MPQTAKVTSIEAIDAFKASLIVYLEKAGSVLDDVSDDVVRTRIWLQSDPPVKGGKPAAVQIWRR